MARPIKTGIDYFPLDIDFLNDIKIRKVVRSVGTEAIGVIISILSNIYRDNGYFIHVDDDFSFLIAEEVNTTELIVEKVVNKLVDVDFFEANMFENHQILTSAGIQKRYVKACEKRKIVELDNEYLLTNFDNTNVKVVNNSINYSKSRINEVNSVNNSINDGRSTQSKVKERKGEERKVNNQKEDAVKELFIPIWNNYPKRMDFNASLLNFELALKDGCTVDEIKLGVENYKTLVIHEERPNQYIKTDVNFFKDRTFKNHQTLILPGKGKSKKQEIQPYWAQENKEPEQVNQPSLDDSGEDLLSEFRSLIDGFKTDSQEEKNEV
ncbi:DUF4373 domain-containing protein [Globicatella sp. PHS-GS-PNBC-21-1553]|uniref:DUF4373 domain-containing protein n=1 Tax=Globicatella sp. PHS-GS-PNBC-21-1553 TaxID=2885764 RepID=UPI00298EDCF5|nr:DUF4373 domain-containing protein [Globicatella sp. PHS-GS-PNBC-21-1553]WPC07987.1 DUF4373 domain-containing protein [Globicatella sp. PHS-GS-PNBC-21-1553]